MQTFALKPKANQQTRYARSTTPGRAHLGQCREVKAILQRTIGNHAVQRQLERSADDIKAADSATTDVTPIPSPLEVPAKIQTKLAVSSPGDIYEQEADRVADQVMRMPTTRLQRACACGGGCPTCRTEQSDHQHQPLQTKEVASTGLGQTALHPTVYEVLRSPGRPLDSATRDFVEPRLGHDFSNVRIHSDSHAAEAARSVHALAYTTGTDVVFGEGQYQPATDSGRKLLAHELTHVVQQNATLDTGSDFSALQRQDEKKKPKPSGGVTTTSGIESTTDLATGEDALKNKYSFDANVKVPLLPGLGLGPSGFLEDIKFGLKGSAERETPIDVTSPDISSLQMQAALTLLKIELMKLKFASEMGEFTLGTNVGTTTTLKQKLGPEGGLTPSFGSSAGLAASLTFKKPTGIGEFTFGSTLGATGSLTGIPGEPVSTLEGKAGLSAGFKSRPIGGPFITLGGVLGENATITAGADVSASAGLGTDKGLTSKVGAGANVGLEGANKGFINLKVSGDIAFDRSSGEFDTKSRSIFVGVSTGFKFK